MRRRYRFVSIITNIYKSKDFALCFEVNSAGNSNYTVSQKKFPPLNSLQLCQILTDFQNFCTAGKRMIFATKPCDNTRHILGMLLHYLGKLNIQIFCRYSADIAEMQTYCILIASNSVSYTHLTLPTILRV